MTRAAELRAEAQELRRQLIGITNPAIRHHALKLIDELEEEARALGNGDAEE